MTIIFDGTQGITTPTETANNSVTTPVVKSGSSLVFQSNGTTEAMRIDTAQNVGVGTASPSSYGKFAVSGQSSLGVDQTDYVNVLGGGGTARVEAVGGNSNINLALSTKGTGAFYIWRGGYGGTNTFLIDGGGRVTMPAQPCFFAFKTDETTISQGNKIPFQSAPVNIGSHYNTSTSRFTAPIAGRYLMQAKVQFASGSTSSVYTGINLTLNGAIYSESYSNQYTGNAHIVPVVCVILQLNAGDYVEIIVGAIAAGAPMIQGSNDKRTVFMGYLLG